MNTPETKLPVSKVNSSSKYLTPCRTFGLKRKSTSPRTPCSKICKSEEFISPLITDQNDSEVALQNSANKTFENVLNAEIKKGSLINKASPLSSINAKSRISKPAYKINLELGEQVSNEKLSEIVKSINFKIDKINILKRNQFYTKKHDINELRKSTEKWKKTCQEVVLAIHGVLKSNDSNISLSDIIDQHNIPFDYIGFNIETMDFD